jgi:hypothetical protein
MSRHIIVHTKLDEDTWFKEYEALILDGDVVRLYPPPARRGKVTAVIALLDYGEPMLRFVTVEHMSERISASYWRYPWETPPTE